jgi:ligand-binding SRPBCC domain-containing protein
MKTPPPPPGCREDRFVREFAASPAELFAFHERDDALALLMPPYPKAVVLERTGGLQAGARVVFELRPLPFVRIRWTAEHVAYEAGSYFVDEQRSGPFAYWRHTHFVEAAPGGSRLIDHVQWRPRPSVLAPLLFPFVRLGLRALFAYRHAATARALARGGR